MKIDPALLRSNCIRSRPAAPGTQIDISCDKAGRWPPGRPARVDGWIQRSAGPGSALGRGAVAGIWWLLRP